MPSHNTQYNVILQNTLNTDTYRPNQRQTTDKSIIFLAGVQKKRVSKANDHLQNRPVSQQKKKKKISNILGLIKKYEKNYI